MSKRQTTAQRGYGGRHQALRRRVAVEVASGMVACARCGLPIRPGQEWDLGHVDGSGKSAYSGPEHRHARDCPMGGNRATAGRGGREAVNLAGYRDDPGEGVFWGPPDRPGGLPRRWSRPWFDWR